MTAMKQPASGSESSTQTNRLRGRAALIAALLAVLLATAAVPTAALAADHTTGPQTASIGSSTLALQDNSTTNNSTTSPNDGSTPTIASQVRITPAPPDADYVSITVVNSDERFNSTGTFATFQISQPVDAVRTKQPHASARVLGDHVIQIQFDRQAAPGDRASLYTVEMFFSDGSSRSFEVMAHNTDITATPSIDPGYASVIDYLENNAKGMGFKATPEGVKAYVQNREERANLFEGLWKEQIETFITLRMAQAFSPLDWVAAIVLLGLLLYWLNSKIGWVMRAQQFAGSKAEMIREALRQEAEEQRNAAAKHSLGDVDGIGRNAERFWKKLGIETVENMIQVTCKGIVATDEHGAAKINEDGHIVLAHQGVADLQAVEPLTERNLRENTWLKPVILEGRLRASTALANIENALLVAEMDYNRGAEVRETRLAVQELLADLQGKNDGTDAKYSSSGTLELPSASNHDSRPGGAPSGGDD